MLNKYQSPINRKTIKYMTKKPPNVDKQKN